MRISPHDLALYVACTSLAVAGTLWVAQGSTILEQQPTYSVVVAPMERETDGPMPLTTPPDPRDALRGGGRFRRAPTAPSEAAQLEAIGYLSGSREAGDASSVVRHDRDRAWQGLNLVTSGHAAEAELLDMDGRVVHRWSRSFHGTWPDWMSAPNENMLFWRKVHPLPDGSLIAIFEGLGIVKLDAWSNLLWARPNAAHHDLEVLPDGTMWVLSRRVEMAEELEANNPTLIDYALHLDGDGHEIERVSLLTAYVNSPFAMHVVARANAGGDSFHTNALRVMDGTEGPPFNAGNLLISVRHVDALALVDPKFGRVVWSVKGDWKLQHDARVLPGRRLLLFDNGPPQRRASRVLELDANNGQELWRYEGTADEPFWSATCGTAQRLDNGNTLITESDGGRAFEVTTDGEIVWEYVNPHRPEDKPEFVATLFEVERLPLDFADAWLPEPETAK